MKINEVLNNNIAEKRDYFEDSLKDFNKQYFPMGRILCGYDFIKVRADNVVDWNKRLHEHLCRFFGLKLTTVNKLEVWKAGDTRYKFHLEYIYVDEQDTNFQELDIDSVKL